MNDLSYRFLPAEWDYQQIILLSWPHAASDWEECLDEVKEYYLRLTELLLKANLHVLVISPKIIDVKAQIKDLKHHDKLYFHECKTNDTWTRDFGPISLKTDKGWILCDFKFNGWGLKFSACYDNLVTSELFHSNKLLAKYENHLGFVLEGGSIESDGNGSLMTTSHCLLSPNRNGNLSKKQIENILKKTLGIKQVLWLNHGELTGDDTDSHIDTLARFGIKKRIIYNFCEDEQDEHYETLEKMRIELQGFRNIQNRPYELIGIPLPDPIYDNRGERLPATYANFLVTPEYVIMPSYNQPAKDKRAEQILSEAFERKVLSIDSNILIRQHGSLHCATMQMPLNIINKEI